MKVVFVVGTTASGKSDLAIGLAEATRGAIVNCDSIQVFKGLDVGSAKPSKEDFARVPHYLFDYVEKGQEFTAGEYCRDFFACLDEIKDKFPVVYVVGGTGFYFQAIEKGMYSIGAADETIKRQVEEELKTAAGAERLYQELLEKDPESAKKIFPNDHYRLGRAIEIIRAHGKSPAQVKKEFEENKKPFPYPLLKLGVQISKEELLPRVELRTEKMLRAGLVEETRGLLIEGLENWAPLSSVGYFETVEFLKGSEEIPDEKILREKIIQNTMRLAKKQRTWFRRDPDIQWVSYKTPAAAGDAVDSFLKS